MFPFPIAKDSAFVGRFRTQMIFLVKLSSNAKTSAEICLSDNKQIEIPLLRAL